MPEKIENMDLKQLRAEVQLLRDEVAIMQRKYEDILYNLDNDNFSTQIIKEKAEMKEGIKVNAEAIDEAEENIAELEVKADEISMRVSKNISAYFESNAMPTAGNTTDEQKTILCLYNGIYYYYNDVKREWIKYPNNGLQTFFIQTADGFHIGGHVRISGDLITEGTIKGVDICGVKFWDANQKGFISLEPVGANEVADFVLRHADGKEVFRIYDHLDGGVSLLAYGNTVLSTGGSGTIRPINTWDFSGCNVIGLENSGYLTKGGTSDEG